MPLVLFFISSLVVAEPLPVRQGVDIYNSTVHHTRLIAFMKIGRPVAEQRFLSFISASLQRQPLPRAFLAGQSIYLKSLNEPLKVVDLKDGQFSYAGKKLDLRSPLQQNFHHLERLLHPRSFAASVWDWFIPFATAVGHDPKVASDVVAVLGVGGLAVASECLRSGRDCGQRLMGTLALIGAVGGLRKPGATMVFCSPDFQGGKKFVVSGQKGNLMSIASKHGQIEISPAHLNAGSMASDRAAAELLDSCAVPRVLENLKIAMAPRGLPTGESTNVAVRVTPFAPTRAPAAVQDSAAR